MKNIYSTLPGDFSLPPFVTGWLPRGTILHPSPELTVIMTIAPQTVKVQALNPDGSPGHMLELLKGEAHVVADDKGHHYMNLEFEPTYKRLRKAPVHDPRTAWLAAFWREHGYDVSDNMWEAVKTAGAILVGRVAPEAVGCKFITHELTTELTDETLILQSPADETVFWPVSMERAARQYKELTLPKWREVRALALDR